MIIMPETFIDAIVVLIKLSASIPALFKLSYSGVHSLCIDIFRMYFVVKQETSKYSNDVNFQNYPRSYKPVQLTTRLADGINLESNLT